MLDPATRARAEHLTALLAREHEALAEFLHELAAFDRDLSWQVYGYASLYDFLVRELGLSKGSAYLRQAAARLSSRFPEVLDALRDGRLCLSVVGQLAAVLTEGNHAEVLPRFFHRSKQEAKVIRAELCPAAEAPTRVVVTPVPPAPATLDRSEAGESWHRGSRPDGKLERAPVPPAAPAKAPRLQVEPVTADLRRLHLTVRQELLDTIAEVQALRSNANPGESLEATLEAALELLLEQERKKKSLVEKPRPAPTPREKPERGCRDDRHVPAAVRREVWRRDQGRCQHRLANGETCGSTHRVELHHTTNWADGGVATVDGLSLRCHRHNQLLAERDFGDGLLAHCRARRGSGELDARPAPR